MRDTVSIRLSLAVSQLRKATRGYNTYAEVMVSNTKFDGDGSSARYNPRGGYDPPV